ncbi:hypothetical protein [Citricoccus zhacaiensis]|nr:hypothetical protein [Citricoccus zhacaiensis]
MERRTWRGSDGKSTRGIALMKGRNSVAIFLTPEQARSLADGLHDLVEDIDAAPRR